MFRVIGVDHKQGVFEGKGYDNYNFHCLSDESSSVLRGFTCEIIKMRVADVSVIFGMPMSPDDVCALVGSYISPLYDRFKRVIRCEIVDPPENCALSAVALP